MKLPAVPAVPHVVAPPIPDTVPTVSDAGGALTVPLTETDKLNPDPAEHVTAIVADFPVPTVAIDFNRTEIVSLTTPDDGEIVSGPGP